MDLSRKSSARMSGCWKGIGDKLWAEIFKRLQTERLCICRCVCKGWDSFISSTAFIRYHYSFTVLSTPPDRKTYLRFPTNIGTDGKLSAHNPYALCFPSHPDNVEEQELHFPFRFVGDVKKRHEVYFQHFKSKNNIPSVEIGCVDVVFGLVCLAYSLDSSFDSTILWNPAIHKYIALPSLPYDPPKDDIGSLSSRARWYSHLIGFGHSGTDFKVMRLWIPNADVLYSYGPLPLVCELYSSRLGLWRRLELAPDNVIHSSQFSSRFDIISRISCFVSATLHWLVSHVHDHLSLSVLMFHLESEEFTAAELPREMFLPLQRDGMVLHRPILFEYAGKLSVFLQFCYSDPSLLPRSDGLSELWAMQEHGVPTSWIKLYSFRDDTEVPMYPPSFIDMAPYSHHQCRVYDESLFLMDAPSTLSYPKNVTVDIVLDEIDLAASKQKSEDGRGVGRPMIGLNASK